MPDVRKHSTLTMSRSLRSGSMLLNPESLSTCERIRSSLSCALWHLSNSSKRVMSVFTAQNGVFCSTDPATPETILYNTCMYVHMLQLTPVNISFNKLLGSKQVPLILQYYKYIISCLYVHTWYIQQLYSEKV